MYVFNQRTAEPEEHLAINLREDYVAQLDLTYRVNGKSGGGQDPKGYLNTLPNDTSLKFDGSL